MSLAKIVADMPAARPWAHLQYQTTSIFGCRDDKVLVWEAKDNDIVAGKEFEALFRDGLTRGGFTVSGDPTNLFERDQKSAELQVAARITSIDATFCAFQKYIDRLRSTDRVIIKGTATMAIEWQVYSTLEGRVVARVPTRGAYTAVEGLDGGNVVILQRAFAENVSQLVASETFRKALVAPPQAVAAAQPTIRVQTPPGMSRRSMAEASRSVVEVTAGESSGTAFLISNSGYLITNNHVVGDATRVRVRWSDQSEGVADVVRSDRRRDVALLKANGGAQPPLGLRLADVQIGETVFAIGTPLAKEFQNTVTRGTVSATRSYEGLSFVQSDVAVDHGNSGGPLLDEDGLVVAITDWGYAPDGVSHNLNFFIPIGDALRALAVEPGAASPSPSPTKPSGRAVVRPSGNAPAKK